MAYVVYILISRKDKKLYVGCTDNLKRRLREHNFKKVPATRNRTPLEIIHAEEFKNKTKAYNRERYLKSLWSARFKRKLKDEHIKKNGLNPTRKSDSRVARTIVAAIRKG